jgi:hypothetical protein
MRKGKRLGEKTTKSPTGAREKEVLKKKQGLRGGMVFQNIYSNVVISNYPKYHGYNI